MKRTIFVLKTQSKIIKWRGKGYFIKKSFRKDFIFIFIREMIRFKRNYLKRLGTSTTGAGRCSGPHKKREKGKLGWQRRIDPGRVYLFPKPFLLPRLIQILNRFKFERILNESKTKAHNQLKIKCRWHENATDNYITPKLIY
jgi:hypothetical protein